MNHSNETDCNAIQDALLELHGDADTDELVCAHLSKCPACKSLRNWDERLARALRSDEVELPMAVGEKTKAHLRHRAHIRVACAAAVAACIFALAGLFLIYNPLQPSDRNESAVKANKQPVPPPENQRPNKEQKTMLAAFGQSPPIVEFGVLARQQEALSTVIDDLSKETP